MSCTDARRAIKTGRFRWQRRQQRMGGWKGAATIPEMCLMRVARDREGEAVQKTAEAWGTLILVLK